MAFEANFGNQPKLKIRKLLKRPKCPGKERIGDWSLSIKSQPTINSEANESVLCTLWVTIWKFLWRCGAETLEGGVESTHKAHGSSQESPGTSVFVLGKAYDCYNSERCADPAQVHFHQGLALFPCCAEDFQFATWLFLLSLPMLLVSYSWNYCQGLGHEDLLLHFFLGIL